MSLKDLVNTTCLILELRTLDQDGTDVLYFFCEF